MAIYTFLIEDFFNNITAEQYEAANESKAILKWANELDFQRYKVKNIYAYKEFYKDILEYDHPPTHINTLDNVWSSYPLIQHKGISIDIVKTIRDKIVYNGSGNSFTIMYYALGGTNISQIKNVKSIDQVIPLWLKQTGEKDIYKYSKPLTKKERTELINLIAASKLTKRDDLVNVWAVKFKYLWGVVELYAIPTSRK